MSVDDRLRSALRDQAETLLPEAERALADVRRRGRRVRLRPAAFAPAAAAAAAAAVVGLVAWLGVPGPGDAPLTGDAGSPTVLAEPEVSLLRGTIVATVSRPRELRGEWELQLDGNGTIDVVAPTGYPGDLTGALFSGDRSTFRTTLLGQDVCRGAGTGIYEWRREGDLVVFDVVSDRCAARVELLAEADWTASTGEAPRG